MTNDAGYSGTPLSKKLGLKDGFSVLLVNPPDHYLKLLGDLPSNIHFLEDLTSEKADFIHLFCTSLSQLEKKALALKPILKKTGMLWVSWPKGSSEIPTTLKREPIRDRLTAMGLVDIKVCAVDQDWSGLKFVYRAKDRRFL
ncbi:DUF3052 domain-containing protein [Sungkyunkwania multivorans]|uniref:DUF3052 domain-containing protein n=1 Tax=Sungkyunkwania multivorans TaxID=1173618 RepID=A0ABW3CXZ2_9FLAO